MGCCFGLNESAMLTGAPQPVCMAKSPLVLVVDNEILGDRHGAEMMKQLSLVINFIREL